jgi:hypothetical protein
MRASAKTRSPKLGPVIARRILEEEGFPKRKIVVSIGMPRKDPLSKHGDWECPFLLQGVGDSTVQRSGGVDSMQALIVAIQGIRVGLEQSGRKFFYIDPKMGSFQIPMFVPTSLGKEFEDRVGLAIERETVRQWRANIKSRRAKIRGHETKLRRQGVAHSKIARSVTEGKQRLRERESWIGKLKPGWSRPKPATNRRNGA